ncbi:MAG: hypothetical protein WBP55_10810 [Solirubrobacterales bacterium]
MNPGSKEASFSPTAVPAAVRFLPALLVLLACLVPFGSATAATTVPLTPEVRWAISVGEIDTAEDEIDGVSVDPNGNTVVSGVFRERVSFGNQIFQSHGLGDIFLASYSPSGEILWAKQFGSTGDDNTFDLKTDGDGNIIASGWFAGTVDFGGHHLTSNGIQDMFLVKFDAKGRTVWARSFGGPQGDGGNEIDVFPNGRIAVAGISDGTFTVDGQTYPFGGGSRDAYALRLDKDGKVKWVRPFNGPGSERIRAIDINSDGEVFVGFQYRGSVQSERFTVTSRGGWDGALAKLSSSGEPVWMLPFGGAGEDNLRGLASGPDGSVYASGLFEGPAILGDREIGPVGRAGDDYLMRISPGGASSWLVTFVGDGTGTGSEIRSDGHGVVTSSVVTSPLVITRDQETIGGISPPGGNPTSYLGGFTPDGTPRFLYTPQSPGTGSGALGDVLGISPDGRYVAQVLRFKGTLLAGNAALSTQSEKDSALIYLRTDVPAATSARLQFRRTPSANTKLVRGKKKRLKFTIRNTGELSAKRVRICVSPAGGFKGRLTTGCRSLGKIPGRDKTTVRLGIKPGGRARSRVAIKVQLKSRNAPNRSRHIPLRLVG